MELKLSSLFHKLQSERRLGVGFAASPRPKPVANRRSILSAIYAACEMSGLSPADDQPALVGRMAYSFLNSLEFICARQSIGGVFV